MSYSQLPTRTTDDTNTAADINQLQLNIEALKGGSGSAAPATTLAAVATSLGKTYVEGTAYTNGTPTLTCSDSGWVKKLALFIPYNTTDGQWWLRASVFGTQSVISNTIFTLNNVNIPSALSGYFWSVNAYNSYASFAQNNSTSLEIYVNQASTNGNVEFHFDFPIAAKPGWAD